MKVKSEDILKPGAVLKVEKIDWPKESPRRKRLGKYSQKYYNNLRRVINI